MLLVTGGIHGDEPSGALALAPIARTGIATCGPCNPWGLAHGVRTLESGRDLNRAFADPNCPEAERVREQVRVQVSLLGGLALLLDLHEDARAQAPYLIQYGPGSPVGRDLVQALSDRYRFEARPRFGPVVGRDGLLCPSRTIVTVVGLSPWWPLVYWVWRTYGAPGCVVEVPGHWPIEERITFHIAVAEAAAAWVAQGRESPSP